MVDRMKNDEEGCIWEWNAGKMDKLSQMLRNVKEGREMVDKRIKEWMRVKTEAGCVMCDQKVSAEKSWVKWERGRRGSSALRLDEWIMGGWRDNGSEARRNELKFLGFWTHFADFLICSYESLNTFQGNSHKFWFAAENLRRDFFGPFHSSLRKQKLSLAGFFLQRNVLAALKAALAKGKSRAPKW